MLRWRAGKTTGIERAVLVHPTRGKKTPSHILRPLFRSAGADSQPWLWTNSPTQLHFASETDQVKMTYHLDGSPNTQTDQRGVVHTYQYDDNRRVELDRVTTIPGGVDGTVKSIGRTYDEFGRVDTVTSYANDNGTGTIRNQIDYDFNTYGKVASTWQSHEGAVVKAGTPTPKMSYTYDSYAESNILVQGLRSHFTDYPDGRRFRDYYGNQSHQTFNRFQRMHQVSHISEPGGTHYLDAVKYAGVSRLMGYRHRVGSTILSVNHDSNNGHDRFGRVKNMLWGSSGSPKSQTQHTYDYAGNRLSRDVHGTTAYDQSYAYDGLHRLKSTDQGNWNGEAQWQTCNLCIVSDGGHSPQHLVAVRRMSPLRRPAFGRNSPCFKRFLKILPCGEFFAWNWAPHLLNSMNLNGWPHSFRWRTCARVPESGARVDVSRPSSQAVAKVLGTGR